MMLTQGSYGNKPPLSNAKPFYGQELSNSNKKVTVEFYKPDDKDDQEVTRR